jgi:hypothetical protein
MKALYSTALTVFMAGAACAHAQLLQNAGFETRDFTGWITSGKGWSIDKEMHSEGKRSALCTVEKGDAPETRACLQILRNIEPGRIVQVDLDVSGINVVQTPSSKASLAILCMDARGNVLKEYRANVIRPTTAFQPVKIDDAVVLPGTEQVCVMLVVEVYEKAANNDWWRFDNVRIAVRGA